MVCSPRRRSSPALTGAFAALLIPRNSTPGASYVSGCCCPPGNARPAVKYKTLTATRTVTVRRRVRALAAREDAESGAGDLVAAAADLDHGERAALRALEPRELVPNHLCPICPTGARLLPKANANGGTGNAAWCCTKRRTVTSTKRVTRTRTVTSSKAPRQTVKGRVFFDVSASADYVPGVDIPLAFAQLVVSRQQVARAPICPPALGQGTTDASGLFGIPFPAQPAGTRLELRFPNCTVLQTFTANGQVVTLDVAIAAARTSSASTSSSSRTATSSTITSSSVTLTSSSATATSSSFTASTSTLSSTSETLTSSSETLTSSSFTASSSTLSSTSYTSSSETRTSTSFTPSSTSFTSSSETLSSTSFTPSSTSYTSSSETLSSTSFTPSSTSFTSSSETLSSTSFTPSSTSFTSSSETLSSTSFTPSSTSITSSTTSFTPSSTSDTKTSSTASLTSSTTSESLTSSTTSYTSSTSFTSSTTSESQTSSTASYTSSSTSETQTPSTTSYTSSTSFTSSMTTQTFPVTIPVFNDPRGIAVSPDGTRTYVTNGGSNTVSIIDNSAFTILTNVPVGSNPIGVAVGAAFAYVANQGAGTVSVIDTSTSSVVGTVPVGNSPIGVAISPDGSKVYITVANDVVSASNWIKVISTASNSVVSTITGVGWYPQGVAFNPVISKAYAANGYTTNLAVINSASDSVAGQVGGMNYGQFVAVDAVGTRAYVSNYQSSVAVVDTSTDSLLATIAGFTYPVMLTVVKDRVFVANSGANTVAVIAATTNSILTSLSVGVSPWGVAANGAGTRLFVSNANSNTVTVLDISNV
ncbi:hypothetical protein DFJ74DRAFT_642810 [Hyaloraphidium curvatum]|nr:hypothetical protein DFJ74DRAFT_642810 [Hyaloraphidium curvatum]